MTDSFRTLFITQQVPYPPMGGGALRNWQNINIMGKYGEVAVFSVSTWTPKRTSVPGVTIWKHYNVAQQRTTLEQIERRLWWLRPHGYPGVDWCYSYEAARKLDELLREFKPDVVIFSEVWPYRYLPIVQGHSCRKILDEHNIEVDNFVQKYSNAKNVREKIKFKRQLPQMKSIEQSFINQMDQVWVCSEEDTHLLGQWFGETKPSYVVPNGLNLGDYESLYQNKINNNQTTENRTIIFLGQLSYFPNTVAVERLLREIYPKIQTMYPDCRLLLVGSNPTQFMLDAASLDSSITITNWVADVKPYLGEASVMIVPLLQGGGTRFKILEAFAAGCPVVSTSKGCEGIDVTSGEHLLIRDSVEDMVQGISQIWSDASLSQKLIQRGHDLFKESYSWEAVSQRVDKAITTLF